MHLLAAVVVEQWNMNPEQLKMLLLFITFLLLHISKSQ